MKTNNNIDVLASTRPARVNSTHAAPLRAGTMLGKRTVRRYEDENHIADGEKTMTNSLHIQTSALTPQRRPAYPRWSSQAPQKRNFLKPEQILIRPSPTTSLQRLKPV